MISRITSIQHVATVRGSLLVGLLVGIVCVGWAVPPAVAQSRVYEDDPYRFIQWSAQDGRGLWRGVRSRHAAYAAVGLGGLVLALSGPDPDLTEGAVDLAGETYPPVRRLANELGNVKLVQPAALMLFIGSLTSDRYRFQDAAFTSLEALVFANFITDALKGLVGRARPFQEEGAQRFRPFSGNTSFPSGHATTVFAFTTPWLLYYRDVPTITLFIMGAGTAFTRMADNQHWFSDVLAGTAIGFTTAFWLTRRHQRSLDDEIEIAPVVAARQAGVVLRVRL